MTVTEEVCSSPEISQHEMIFIFHYSVVIGLVTVLVVIGTGYDLVLQRRIKHRDTELPGK
jgi:hypothetical protein